MVAHDKNNVQYKLFLYTNYERVDDIQLRSSYSYSVFTSNLIHIAWLDEYYLRSAKEDA
jgi:hypothetical protein